MAGTMSVDTGIAAPRGSLRLANIKALTISRRRYARAEEDGRYASSVIAAAAPRTRWSGCCVPCSAVGAIARKQPHLRGSPLKLGGFGLLISKFTPYEPG